MDNKQSMSQLAGAVAGPLTGVVRPAWMGVAKATESATKASSDFVKMLMTGGVIVALKQLVDKRKELANPRDRDMLANYLGSPQSVAALTQQLTVLQSRVDSLKKGRQTSKKKREAGTLQDQIPDLEQQIRSSRITEALESQVDLLKNVKEGFASAIVLQTVSRWYDFNRAVGATNVSLEQRRTLYDFAVKQELTLGRSLKDTTAILEMARRSGLIYGKTIDSSLGEVVKLSLQAEDALGLQPEQIEDIYMASKRMAEPYHDVLDAITGINQGLGLSGEEAGKLYGEVSNLAFGFGISGGKGVRGVTGELAKMELALKNAGISDSGAAARLMSKMTDSSQAASWMFGGGPQILQDRDLLKSSLSREAGYLQPFAGNANTQVGSIVWDQMTKSIGLTRDEGFELIDMMKQLNTVLKDTSATAVDVSMTAERANELNGKVWGRLWHQIRGAFDLALVPLTYVVEGLTEGASKLYHGYLGLSDGAQSAVKWIGALVVSLVTLEGAMVAAKAITTIVSALNGFGVLGGTIPTIVKGLTSMIGTSSMLGPLAEALSAGLAIVLPPLLIAVIGAAVVYAVYQSKIGEKIGEALSKSTTPLERLIAGFEVAAIKAFSHVYNWVRDNLSFLHLPSLEKTHVFDTAMVDRQNSAAQQLFASSGLTTEQGRAFLRSQDDGLTASGATGEVKAVHENDINALNAQISQLTDEMGRSHTFSEQTALIEHQKALLQLLQDLKDVTQRATDQADKRSREMQENRKKNADDLKKSIFNSTSLLALQSAAGVNALAASAE